MRNLSKIVFVFIIFSVFLLSGCEKPNDLKLRFDQKETIHYVHRIDMKIDTQVIEMPVKFTINMAIHFDEKTLAPDEAGHNRIQNMINRVMMDFDLGVMSFKADSANPGSGQKDFDEIVNSMVGMKFVQVMDDKGNIIRVEGVEELAKVFDAGPSNAAGKQMYDRLVESMSNSYYFPLPDKPVKIGDTWKAKPKATDLGFLGKIEFGQTLKLEKIEDGIAYITSEPELTGDLFNGDKNTGMPAGMSVKFNEVKMTAEYYFDMKMGRMRKQVIHMDMNVEAKGGPTGNIPMMFKTIQETLMVTE